MKFWAARQPSPCAFDLADQFRRLAHTWLRQRYRHHRDRGDYRLAGHCLLLDGHVIQAGMAACDHRAVALVHEAVTLQRNPIERSFEILDTAEQPHPSP